MCGIIGFTGRLEAQKILTEGLAALEYRGYDSAGIAYFFVLVLSPFQLTTTLELR